MATLGRFGGAADVVVVRKASVEATVVLERYISLKPSYGGNPTHPKKSGPSDVYLLKRRTARQATIYRENEI